MEKNAAAKIPVVYVRLLIVNDEKDILYVCRLALEKAGFHVDCSENPLDALQKFQPGMYDMVLIDIQMPKMDGITLFQRMREIDPLIKVCFLSASSNKEEIREKVKKENGNHKAAYLWIPIRPHQIVDIVKNELGVVFL